MCEVKSEICLLAWLLVCSYSLLFLVLAFVVYINPVAFLLFIVRSVDVITISPREIGQLLIIDCSSDTFNVQSTTDQIVGQSLILRCTVNTVRPNNDLVNLTWTSNNKTLKMMDQIGLVQDHYIISQLNTSNDGQSFKCIVMINAAPPVFGSSTIVLNLTGKSFISCYCIDNMHTKFLDFLREKFS